jgi:peptidoglycan/LPS O-acetylase OafA/YrhL
VAALGFTLIIAASVMCPSFVMNRMLALGPIALVGTVSYSLYLWHEPLMILLDNRGLLPHGGGFGAFVWGLAVVVPIAVAVAWVSYQAIERPGLALRGLVDRYGRSRDYYDGS